MAPILDRCDEPTQLGGSQMTTQVGSSLLQLVSEMQDRKKLQELNWAGTFSEYLDTVGQNPKVTRNAFQRIYDMIMSYGVEEFIDAKKRLIRYRFFSDLTFDINDCATPEERAGALLAH